MQPNNPFSIKSAQPAFGSQTPANAFAPQAAAQAPANAFGSQAPANAFAPQAAAQARQDRGYMPQAVAQAKQDLSYQIPQPNLLPSQTNMAAIAQTARMTSATQGNKPQGPLGIVPDATPGMVSVEQKNAKQTTDASSAATNASKAGPATTQVSGNLGTTTGAASGTGLISGQMMSRRI